MYIKGKIIIAILDTGKADVHVEGLDPLQVAQALAAASAQILGQERAKQNRDNTHLVMPNINF